MLRDAIRGGAKVYVTTSGHLSFPTDIPPIYIHHVVDRANNLSVYTKYIHAGEKRKLLDPSAGQSAKRQVSSTAAGSRLPLPAAEDPPPVGGNSRLRGGSKDTSSSAALPNPAQVWGNSQPGDGGVIAYCYHCDARYVRGTSHCTNDQCGRWLHLMEDRVSGNLFV